MLKLENIKGGYAKGSLVLQGIDMEVAPGEVVGIIGTNGCGKSTLGKAIMNLVPFRYGQVYFDSENVSNLQAHELNGKGISMLMQGGRIFRNMSVFEHLKLVSGLKNETNVSVRIEDIAKSIGITKFISSISLKSRGGYLSGGEKQILKLMMALMNNPKCLILDEISAGMSPANLEII
ncbi:MAG TPA: ATP-binding cassette domain-containing protein, partial [Bacteroidales bacterium]|nr:ATP-binding cassette domain-containing protein [Bacteroidales bacterium]